MDAIKFTAFGRRYRIKEDAALTLRALGYIFLTVFGAVWLVMISLFVAALVA